MDFDRTVYSRELKIAAMHAWMPVKPAARWRGGYS